MTSFPNASVVFALAAIGLGALLGFAFLGIKALFGALPAVG